MATEKRFIISFPGSQGFLIDLADYAVLYELMLDGGLCPGDLWQTLQDTTSSSIQKDGRISIDEHDIHRRLWELVCPKDIKSLRPSIGQLDALEVLNLEFAKHLTRLPTEIGNLSSLVELNMDSSAITSLPPSIGQLDSLEFLNLNHATELTHLPPEIGGLKSLTRLHLENTAITALPPSIGQLDALECLNLEGTRFLKCLPEEIGNLTSLCTLDLRGSGIQSLPPSIGRLQALEILDISKTKNLFTLPIEILNLPDLNATLQDYGRGRSFYYE